SDLDDARQRILEVFWSPDPDVPKSGLLLPAGECNGPVCDCETREQSVEREPLAREVEPDVLCEVLDDPEDVLGRVEVPEVLREPSIDHEPVLRWEGLRPLEALGDLAFGLAHVSIGLMGGAPAAVPIARFLRLVVLLAHVVYPNTHGKPALEIDHDLLDHFRKRAMVEDEDSLRYLVREPDRAVVLPPHGRGADLGQVDRGSDTVLGHGSSDEVRLGRAVEEVPED